MRGGTMKATVMLRKWMLAALAGCIAGPAAHSKQTHQRSADAQGHQWWQHAVFYQIYPRCFADDNNDGIGHLNGIASELDYLKELGVDASGITPCLPSHQ